MFQFAWNSARRLIEKKIFSLLFFSWNFIQIDTLWIRGFQYKHSITCIYIPLKCLYMIYIFFIYICLKSPSCVWWHLTPHSSLQVSDKWLCRCDRGRIVAKQETGQVLKSPARREIFSESKLNQTKFGLKLHFSDWFGTDHNFSVCRI